MADKSDEVVVSWVKLRGSNCPAYPAHTTVAELSVFLSQMDPGDALLITRPLPKEGGERLRHAEKPFTGLLRHDGATTPPDPRKRQERACRGQERASGF